MQYEHKFFYNLRFLFYLFIFSAQNNNKYQFKWKTLCSERTVEDYLDCIRLPSLAFFFNLGHHPMVLRAYSWLCTLAGLWGQLVVPGIKSKMTLQKAIKGYFIVLALLASCAFQHLIICVVSLYNHVVICVKSFVNLVLSRFHIYNPAQLPWPNQWGTC